MHMVHKFQKPGKSGSKAMLPMTAAFAFSLFQLPAVAAFTYKDCPDLAPKDFTSEILTSNATDKNLEEPMKMAFDMDAQGNVDVYFTQRQGLFRKYDGLKKATVDLADFAAYPNFTKEFSGGSDGLLGVALDPAFKANHWVYLYVSTNVDWRVSRFTLNGEKLDMASEKVLIKIVQAQNSQHPGGALQFDTKGDLWITVGDNHKEWPAANTNDLRGKILRIHPNADGTYTNPDGNLFPVGTDKTRPEIYIMGNRNPYTLTLDSVRHAIAWGDVGPDHSALEEEHDFASKPGFHGWPFYAGNQLPQGKGAGTPAAPINNDPANTGLANLPPAIPGFDNYKESCSITGPVYYYNPASPSKVKMPPHFNGMWFVSDFSHFAVEALVLDGPGNAILSRQPVFADMKLNGILDFQAGPDGAFYFVNYAGYRSVTSATGLVRIVYNGTCRPGTVSSVNRPEWVVGAIQLQGSLLSVTSQGAHTVEVKDISGRLLARFQGQGPARHDLSETHIHGLAVITVSTELGNYSWKLVRP